MVQVGRRIESISVAMQSREEKKERSAMLPASGSVSSILTRAHTAGDSMSNLHLFFSVNREMLIKKAMKIGRKKVKWNKEPSMRLERDSLPVTEIKSNAAQCSRDMTSRSHGAACVYGMMK